MKRSEMLDLIDTIVSNSALSSNCDRSFKRVREWEQELANEILQKIEDAGMLPPIHDGTSYDFVIQDYDTVSNVKINPSWEKE